MFNNDFKDKFIKEKSNVPLNFVNNAFNKANELEEFYEKDICNFTLDEIKNLLLTFNSTSIEYLRVLTSIFRKYTNYMIENNLSLDNINHYDSVDSKLLKTCVNKEVIKNKYLNREDLLKYMKQLPNPSDKWVLLSIYEGVKGEKFCNVTLSKGIFNYDNRTIKLYDGCVFKPSNELFESAIKSYETYEYEGLKNLGTKSMRLTGEEILKVRDNVMFDIEDKDKAYNRLLSRVRLIKNYLDIPTLTIPRLQLSGMVYQFKCIMKRENKTYGELFDTNEFLEIRKKFGYDKYVKSRLWATIKDYM